MRAESNGGAEKGATKSSALVAKNAGAQLRHPERSRGIPWRKLSGKFRGMLRLLPRLRDPLGMTAERLAETRSAVTLGIFEIPYSFA